MLPLLTQQLLDARKACRRRLALVGHDGLDRRHGGANLGEPLLHLPTDGRKRVLGLVLEKSALRLVVVEGGAAPFVAARLVVPNACCDAALLLRARLSDGRELPALD